MSERGEPDGVSLLSGNPKFRASHAPPKPCREGPTSVYLIYSDGVGTIWLMHPNKHIREALKYAQSQGWRIVMSNGHAYCRIYCGIGHADCKKSVWSTPRNPENHAKDIRHIVDACPGAGSHEP